MKPVILLIGKNGQIGGELLRLLPQLGEVIAPGRDQLDLLKPSEIRGAIREVQPQLIVNAAAYTAVDQAEKDQLTANAINAEAPEVMAEEAKRIGAVLLHYSTDYVFDGTKNTPYDEADSANPLNVYGKTKFAGEQAIRNSGVSHLILRTSWVYDTRGRNFLLSILRLATNREELRVVNDQVGAPTCAFDVAAATSKLLEDVLDRSHGNLVSLPDSGTYHMSAAGHATWYEFANAILNEAETASRHLEWLAEATERRDLIAKRVIPISSEEFHSPARRPSYSVLSNYLLYHTFDVTLPHWRSQLQRCFVTETTPARVPAN